MPKIGGVLVGEGVVVQASRLIMDVGDKGDEWLDSIGVKITDSAAIVNAVDPAYDLGGSTINGALSGWMTSTSRKIENRTYLDGSPKNIKTSKAGGLSTFQISGTNMSQMSACGPNFGSDIGSSKSIKSIEEAFEMLKKMYVDMLKYADKNNQDNIILCALSSDGFANSGKNADGTSFNKEQAKAAVFIAAKEGIEEFKSKHSKSKLKIIVNNFGGVQSITL